MIRLSHSGYECLLGPIVICLSVAFFSVPATASTPAKNNLQSHKEQASTMTATCKNFEGQAVRIQKGESPAQKLIAADKTKITLTISNVAGTGSFEIWPDSDSDPIEGQILMEAPPANNLRVFFGLMGGFIPIEIGLYHEPDKMIYSTLTSMPKDYKTPDTAGQPFIFQGDMMYGDCSYETGN
jgi:hypothetical protein